MANSLKGNVWVVDTPGIITDKPIWIRGIMLYPTSDPANIFYFNAWDEGAPISGTDIWVPSATITGTNTFTNDDTDANVLTSSYADGSVLKIISSTGSTANHGYHLINTAGDEDAIVTKASLTNETQVEYHIVAYPGRVVLKVIMDADTNQKSMWIPFDGELGFGFHNLALEDITSTASAILYLS
jgi:hypothetical protein